MKTDLSEQEKFWRGDFGAEYIQRNQSQGLLAANLHFFAKIFSHCSHPVHSVLEMGANIGMNMRVISRLLPQARLAANEINEQALQVLKQQDGLQVYPGSLFDFHADQRWDFVFTKGVLIHLNPEKLPQAYAQLYRYSNRYICVAEYYNPSPVSIPYRGHSDRLFKRDFAGELLKLYPDLKLLQYGFHYHADPLFPQDDITWFLLEKSPSQS